jgi:hypothetical protein
MIDFVYSSNMAQASSVDYRILELKLLHIRIPAVGARTAADFGVKNFEKLLAEEIAWVFPELDIKKETIENIFEHHFVEQDHQSSFDTQPPFQLSETILTGSLSEGIYLPFIEPPDWDFMCVLKNIMFSKKDQEDGCLSLRDDTPFVYAFVTNKETQYLWREFYDDAAKKEGVYRLSSRKLKQKLHENYQKSGRTIFPFLDNEQLQEVTEGAALTVRASKASCSLVYYALVLTKKIFYQPIAELLDTETLEFLHSAFNSDTFFNRKLFSSDIVLSIFCEGWPSCANEWIIRKRLWPDIHSVNKITQGGFHIVPKSSPDGDFRLSFSCAEKMLIKTLIPLQHKVMTAFKAVVKYYQKTWSSNLKEIISSYHLKTIAFWHFEKSSQESWTVETLVHHLITLLEELAEALRMQNLPMYFMPKFNLLQDVDDPEITLELMEKISQLSHNFSAMSKAVSIYTATH